jgi:hypothetical protein
VEEAALANPETRSFDLQIKGLENCIMGSHGPSISHSEFQISGIRRVRVTRNIILEIMKCEFFFG